MDIDGQLLENFQPKFIFSIYPDLLTSCIDLFSSFGGVYLVNFHSRNVDSKFRLHSVQFCVLASEFSVEAKNINCSAGECHYFCQNWKGGQKETKILLSFGQNITTLPSKMMEFFGFCTKFSSWKTKRRHH